METSNIAILGEVEVIKLFLKIPLTRNISFSRRILEITQLRVKVNSMQALISQ